MRKQLCCLILTMFAVVLAFVSCGGGGGNSGGGGETISVAGVSLNKNSMTLTAGGSETLSATITPSNATNKGVTWTSSNDAIASVSGGRVTGVAQGAATITVRTNDGGHTASCSVTMNPAPPSPIAVTGVSLNKNTMTLTVGGTEQLTHTIQPSNATNQSVTWETSSSAVATVTNGLVMAIAPGSATITVRTLDGNHTATCAVTVNPAAIGVTGVILNKNATTLTAGSTEQLTHTIQPSNATNQNVTWETNNSAAATVANGLVTAMAPGSATITVRTLDGNHTATCAVTVNPAAIGVTGVILNKNATTLTAGSTEQLTHTIQPPNATNQNVTWETNNSAAATVANGLVTAVAQGSATITVRTLDGNHTATCAVTVNPAAIGVTGVILNKNATTLAAGSTEQLTHTIQPPNATNQNVTWETNNSAAATVANGLVTAMAPGSATITVRTLDGNHTASCAVTVNPAAIGVTGVILNKNATMLTVGGTEQLTHTIQPPNATNQNVTWETNNSAAATVTNGLVTAIAPGSATITVRTLDGNHTASCVVTVVGPSTGTPDTSWYYNNPTATIFTLTTAEQLAGLAALVNGYIEDFSGKTIILGNDIDLSAYASGYGGWTPIGYGYDRSFSGVFNGNGKTISSLTINRTSTYVGLFGSVYGGTVQNLGIVNASISGYNVGGIAGFVYSNSSITNCYSTGAVSSIDNDLFQTGVGGIAGRVSANSSITNCYSTAAVSSTDTGIVQTGIGGIAGYVDSYSSITNCYSTGAISGRYNAGGIAGYVTGAGSITNCYSTGAISGRYYAGLTDTSVGGIAGGVSANSSITGCAALNVSVTVLTVSGDSNYIGRVAGYVNGAGTTLSNNIAWSGMLANGSIVSGTANDKNGADKTAAEIRNGSAFNGMFTDGVWTKQNGYLPGLFGQVVPIPPHIANAPIVAPLAPDTNWYNFVSTTFTLNTAEQLAGLAELVNSGADTFSGKTIILGNNIDLFAYSGGEGWTPIGDYDAYRPFSGTFNGDYKTISNLAINRTSDDYIGLFGYVSYGKVQNLGMVNASVSGGNYIGGIAGYVYGADVMNCYSTGVISGTGNFVGGIAGYIYDSSAENCYSTAAISGAGYVGGIAGHVGYSGVVTGCAALNISVIGSGDNSYIGRIAGYANDSDSSLSNNIAWSGMLVGGVTVFGTANDKNGADANAAAIHNGSAFNNMFTDSVWTKQAGYLPWLLGQTVPIPAHIN